MCVGQRIALILHLRVPSFSLFNDFFFSFTSFRVVVGILMYCTRDYFVERCQSVFFGVDNQHFRVRVFQDARGFGRHAALTLIGSPGEASINATVAMFHVRSNRNFDDVVDPNGNSIFKAHGHVLHGRTFTDLSVSLIRVTSHRPIYLGIFRRYVA